MQPKVKTARFFDVAPNRYFVTPGTQTLALGYSGKILTSFHACKDYQQDALVALNGANDGHPKRPMPPVIFTNTVLPYDIDYSRLGIFRALFVGKHLENSIDGQRALFGLIHEQVRNHGAEAALLSDLLGEKVTVTRFMVSSIPYSNVLLPTNPGLKLGYKNAHFLFFKYPERLMRSAPGLSLCMLLTRSASALLSAEIKPNTPFLSDSVKAKLLDALTCTKSPYVDAHYLRTLCQQTDTPTLSDAVK